LNGSVSDYGTTSSSALRRFAVDALKRARVSVAFRRPVYSCSRFIRAVFPRTDFSVLVNLLDSEARITSAHAFWQSARLCPPAEAPGKGRIRIDPRSARRSVDSRGDGGRVGATAAPQLSWGRNLAVLNVTLTAASACPLRIRARLPHRLRLLPHPRHARYRFLPWITARGFRRPANCKHRRGTRHPISQRAGRT